MKVVIVGGGVMGMMQARELAQKGCQVELLDKGLCGSEASWAGGGIVSPLYPWRYQDAITTLAQWSQSYYPNLIQSLEAESGVDPELTRHGMLVLDLEDQDNALSWSKNYQPSWIEQIAQERLYQLEPSLRVGYAGAMWMPHIGSVRNPRLLRALGAALGNESNVTIREGQKAKSLVLGNGQVKGIETETGQRFGADKVILCSGAWSSEILNSFGLDRVDVSVEPVKGQMLIFDAKPGLVNRVVLNKGKYVIPRRDGQVLAGSTLEYAGFDKETSEGAKEELADIAIDMFPALASCPISHHWAGLRPGSPNGVPYIGPVPEVDGLYINAGHFRNGLVLAPASVRLMTSWICEEDAPFDAQPYRPKSKTTANN